MEASNAAGAGSMAGVKRSVEVSAEELEIKRQRKLQVLQMLQGDDAASLTEPAATSTVPPTTTTATDYAANATDITHTGPPGDDAMSSTSSHISTTTTTNPATAPASAQAAIVKKISIKSKLPSTSSKTTFHTGDDDESAPVREIVKLEYTQDELNELHSTNATYNQFVDDYHLDDDFGSYKKKTGAHVGANLGTLGASAGVVPNVAGAVSVPDLSSIQARVLAQAQALSLALKSGTAGASASVSAPQPPVAVAVPVVANAKTEADKLKDLVDQIPTDRDALFAYPVQWRVLAAHNIISDVMVPWVNKKVTEYLGEEEPSLVEFIISKLTARCSAGDLLEELSVVLDDAAEAFVLKLWRMLVYYSVKNQ